MTESSDHPTFTVDGRELTIERGRTVIEIARDAGIEIPHYCYHPGLSIAGNCRICMVEVEGWPKPQIACKLSPSPGMVVKTQTPLAVDARKATMEFLLVNHPLDCPICDQAGECHLQDYSYQLGQGESRALVIVPAQVLPGAFLHLRRKSTGGTRRTTHASQVFVLTLSPKGPIFGGLAGANISLETNERAWLGEHCRACAVRQCANTSRVK